MNDRPDVSVVMSVYNDASYLCTSIESVLRQQGVSFEFIIIDDGSTDGSGRILDDYADKDDRVRVVHQKNQGLTRALIVGCELARGKYIARQDSDDLSFAGRLDKLTAELDSHPNSPVATSLTAVIGPASELLLSDHGTTDSNAADASTFCHGSLMFRKEAFQRIGGYRPEFLAAQDVDLQLRLAEVGRTRIVTELLYAYRASQGSISASSPIQKRLSVLAQKARDTRREGGDEKIVLAEASRVSAEHLKGKRSEPGMGDYFIGRCLFAQRDPRALGYLWASCTSSPSIRKWLALLQALPLIRSKAGLDVSLSGIVPRQSLTDTKPTRIGQGIL